MRVLGAMMICSGCLGLGIWYRNRFIGRIRGLRNLHKILELLLGEIRYGRSTLPECCGNVAAHMEEPYRSSLRAVCIDYGTGAAQTFAQIFGERMRTCLDQVPLQAAEKAIFFELFTEQGFQDSDMQIKSLERGMTQLALCIRAEEGELREKCRMAVGLGMMSGLLVVILLI
ncbi:MAG: stage III sporulation protein AB [Lachnospiraceae bacterium]|nr:stage III sporulation protein AB [Lachnospiraceae bacterium]